MRYTFVLVGLIACGCGTASVVTYDELHDESKIAFDVSHPKLSDRPDVRCSLYVSMTGKGRKPTGWRCSVGLFAYGPKDMPDILTPDPSLEIGLLTKKEGSYSTPPTERSRDQSAFFGVELDDLITLAESGTYKVNDETYRLTGEEQAKLKGAIIEARRASAP
jgi:hypothetical protein